MTSDRAQIDYLRWLSGHAPELFRRLSHRFRTGLGELGWIQAVVQAVAAVGSAVIAKKQQDKAVKLQKKAELAAAAEAARVQKELADTLVQVNTQRAQRGLPPVDQNGNVIASANLPNPSILTSVQSSVGGVPTIYLILGGAALLGVVVFSRR